MKKELKAKFDLEKQYQDYLKKVNLSESKMPFTQRVETRRTFYGACGTMFVTLIDAMDMIDSDKDAYELFDYIKDQITGEFAKQIALDELFKPKKN